MNRPPMARPRRRPAAVEAAMAEVALHMTTTKRIALAAAVVAVLSGCADDTDELRARIAEVKSRPGGRIEPLPEVKPYETFAYAAADQRSPFEAGVPASSNAPNALRPDVNRRASFSSSSRSTRCAWSARCASAAAITA